MVNQSPDPAGQPFGEAGIPQSAGYPAPGAPSAAQAVYGPPATGTVPPGMYLDQASGLVLPQGVILASPGRRIGAYFLSIPLAIITLGIGYAIWGLIVWGSGTTPALQVLGMRCWKPDTGQVPGWGTMLLRETIGRIVDGILVITALVSFIFMLSRPDRRCLHDLVAGTVVVEDPDKVLAATAP
jgi:uncharacterized RDD family membrane protein YckC